MRAAVDLLAGTYMAQGRWAVAKEFYLAVGRELEGSKNPERVKAGKEMAGRFEEVDRLRERAEMNREDELARRYRQLLRNPTLAEVRNRSFVLCEDLRLILMAATDASRRRPPRKARRAIKY